METVLCRTLVCLQSYIKKSTICYAADTFPIAHRPSQRAPEHSRAATCCVRARRGGQVSPHTTEYLLCPSKPSAESMNGLTKPNKKMANGLLYVDEAEVNTVPLTHLSLSLSVNHSMLLSRAYLYALCRCSH